MRSHKVRRTHMQGPGSRPCSRDFALVPNRDPGEALWGHVSDRLTSLVCRRVVKVSIQLSADLFLYEENEKVSSLLLRTHVCKQWDDCLNSQYLTQFWQGASEKQLESISRRGTEGVEVQEDPPNPKWNTQTNNSKVEKRSIETNNLSLRSLSLLLEKYKRSSIFCASMFLARKWGW